MRRAVVRCNIENKIFSTERLVAGGFQGGCGPQKGCSPALHLTGRCQGAGARAGEGVGSRASGNQIGNSDEINIT